MRIFCRRVEIAAKTAGYERFESGIGALEVKLDEHFSHSKRARTERMGKNSGGPG